MVEWNLKDIFSIGILFSISIRIEFIIWSGEIIYTPLSSLILKSYPISKASVSKIDSSIIAASPSKDELWQRLRSDETPSNNLPILEEG